MQVGTVSVEKSEILSNLLAREGVKHNVLNAKYHEKEAEIIAQAGKPGAVTISTNMAGRGTDIKLGGNAEFMAKAKMRSEGYEEWQINEATGYAHTEDEEIITLRLHYRQLVKQFEAEIIPEAEKVKKAGGLFVLATERHESRRIDNQLRGRSGRQGDPGASRFYLSMEDDLMRLFGSDRIMGVVNTLGLDENQPINARILANSIESAQKRLESINFDRRKRVLEYDDIMNRQREIVYSQRRDVLDGKDLQNTIWKMVEDYVNGAVSRFCVSDIPDEWNFDGLRSNFLGVLCDKNDFNYNQEELASLSPETISKMLLDRAKARYAYQEQVFTPERFREIERIVLLENVDRKWVDHIDAMDDLETGVGLNAYAQRDPLAIYKIESGEMFDEMISSIKNDTVRMLLTVAPRKPMERKQIMTAANDMNVGRTDKKVKITEVKNKKVGPKEPCPCGSGLKYKKCCMAKDEKSV